MKVFKIIRFFLGLIFLLLYTSMFFGIIFLSPLAKIQFIPAIFSLKNGVIASLFVILIHLLLTSVFGRVYCGFLCPFGFLGDLFILWKKNFSFRKIGLFLPAFSILVFVLSLLYLTFIIGFLDPYSLFGKFISLFVKPLVYFLNNKLHFLIPLFGYLRAYEFSFWLLIMTTFFFTLIFLPSIVFGRFFCNFICPAGAVFRFFTKMSIFKLKIYKEKCIKCMRCERFCPALCIDSKEFYLDYSRCLLCMRCFVCPTDAIKFESSTKRDISKVEFLSQTRNLFIFLLSLFFGNRLFGLSDYKVTRILPSPPGSISFERLKKSCVSCLLCVSHCPSKVIKPAFAEYGIDGLFLPVMNYPKSFCIYECNVCGNVCPTSAIKPYSFEEKRTFQIGRVNLIKEKCIVYRDKTDCGACSEVCPTKAVFMVKYIGGLFAPETDIKYCVGCGACENVCPAKPEKAIYVEGNQIHQRAVIREKDKGMEDEKIEEFPF